ncbi:hypothetical protein PsorP6_005378 [Peronosclerospora sorghi]|uniref:Uncharacterized protein n=1 Tax=Peronosclerospora sorghi TaxID=230839 RepID=A0ACC0W227_9STRA|nr:hypothetical protein PsorP6_005378 [Peronosclerospora sorghi]
MDNGVELRVCSGCKLTIHQTCYEETLPLCIDTKKNAENEKEKESFEWKCDCCRQGVERQTVRCIYCRKSGDIGALKLVETGNDVAFWSRYAEVQDEKMDTSEDMVQFGHMLCMNWDPRRLAAHIVKESKMKHVVKAFKKLEATTEVSSEEKEKGNDEVVTEVKEDAPVKRSGEVLLRELLPPDECCFCHIQCGVRIQCRRVKCARHFHAMCAHQGNGHVELRTGHLVQFHAYCDRHRECGEDIGDLLSKLITRPIRLLVGRDDMRRFGTVAKHLPDYHSAAAVLLDLANLMVGYCNKGLRASKTESPDYNMKHLQVLQFFLGHVPQLEKVYALPFKPAQDYVDDAKLFRRLQRTFDPPSFVAKFPGPSSQQYTCDVCKDPFYERQHLFYCSGEDKSTIPHVQHWKCTKRRSNARERERWGAISGNTAAKKKSTISIVHDGIRKDIPIPKGLPSLTDDIVCGVCNALVDARGLLTAREEAKNLDLEKRESKFVQNGCYINPISAKGYSYGSTPSSRKSSRSTDGKLNSSLMGQQNAAAQQSLGPPKMDRINVQRTTKWLTCVAQIIRLVGAQTSTTAAPSLPCCPAATKPRACLSNVAASGSASSGIITAFNSAAVPTDAATNSNNAPETKSSFPTKIITSSDSAPLPALSDGKDLPRSAAAALISRNGNGVSKSSSSAHVPLACESCGVSKEMKDNLPLAATQDTAAPSAPSPKLAVQDMPSLVTPAVQALFDEVMRLVRPYDSYALNKLETAYDMLFHRSGPGVAVLRMFTHEYTRFVYIKHTRAVEKAQNEKRKRAEHEAQAHRVKERKRMNLEAERALKKQMLAMRNKQRQHLKTSSLK